MIREKSNYEQLEKLIWRTPERAANDRIWLIIPRCEIKSTVKNYLQLLDDNRRVLHPMIDNFSSQIHEDL